ncbi:hypothetical protein K8I61_05475 [bacterium]|nr:hypothetical protein [bacterium]
MTLSIMRASWPALLVLVFAVFAATGCSCGDDDDDDDDDPAPADDDVDDGDDDTGAADDDDAAPGAYAKVRVDPGENAGTIRRLTADDVAHQLRAAGARDAAVEDGATPGADTFVFRLRVDRESGGAESFVARTRSEGEAPHGPNVIEAIGADERGAMYGAYRALEAMGFRFFHPEQTYAPTLDGVRIDADFEIADAPAYARRGFHIHTMHPIEMTEILMRDRADYRAYANRMIDWLARNGQNYFQFELLRTANYDGLVDHLGAIVDYAHARGVDAGVTVTWVFLQQKAWRLVPSVACVCKEEMEGAIDYLMQVPWDHINLELGSSEFTPVSDELQVTWMNNTVAHLSDRWPGTEASVKIHVSTGQESETYGGNFNFIPRFADTRMGVYPHTVMYYGFVGPAPAYENEDFSEMLAFTLEMAGERKTYYYPETAYWVSFDIDVPTFLPIYLLNRWRDADLLADKGLAGHVDFTSGHEWGYWLNDWALSRYLWSPEAGWEAAVETMADVFGDAADDVAAAVVDLTEAQEEFLVHRVLASYLAGSEAWDELGYLVGAETHPKPVTIREIYKMNAGDLDAFEAGVLADLSEMGASFESIYERLQNVSPNIPQAAHAWYDELRDGFRVTALRARHAYELYAGVIEQRRAELGDDAAQARANEHFANAVFVREEAMIVIRGRELAYRYPFELSSGFERSLTSYDYKYLWPVSTGFYWMRYEAQAIEKKTSPFFMNPIDLLWFFQ